MTQQRPAEPQPFKASVGSPLVEELAQRLLAVYPTFPATQFIAEVTPQLEPLELKGRIAAIAAGLRRHLPPDYPAAVCLLLALLDPPPAEAEGMFGDGWLLWPVAAFVEHYGLEHLDESLQAMHAITQRHAAEFAIRFPIGQVRLALTLQARPAPARAGSAPHRPRRPPAGAG